MNKHKSFGFFSVFDRKKKNRKPKPKLFGFGTEIFGFGKTNKDVFVYTNLRMASTVCAIEIDHIFLNYIIR